MRMTTIILKNKRRKSRNAAIPFRCYPTKSYRRRYVERRRAVESDENGRCAASGFSYWNYAAREPSRAVSEPDLRTVRIPAAGLPKSNSFGGLRATRRSRHGSPPFDPERVAGLRVTETQCCRVNCTRTDGDLVEIFGKPLRNAAHALF